MQRFVISLAIGSVLSGFVSAPAIAASSVKDCPKRDGMVAVRVDENGTCYYKRASVDSLLVATSVPQGGKPIPPLPGRRDRNRAVLLDGNDTIARRIVDTVKECGDDVALPAPDGRVECVPTPQVEEKQAVTPAPGCRVIGRSPRGPIIGCGEVAQVPDPAVPDDEQDPSEIYPNGLPPAPTEFTPPKRLPTPLNPTGSGAARFSSLLDLVSRA